MTILTDDLVTEGLLAGGGILSATARYLAERLRRRGAHVMDGLPCKKRGACQSSTRDDQKPKA